MNTYMEKEILSQSKLLNRTYDTNIEIIEKLADSLKKNNIRQIFLAGRGSSNNAGMYFKYLFEIYVGIPVSFIHPSVITQYKSKLRMANTCVIGISQSGKALDVMTVINEAQSQGAITVAITNDLASPMALLTQYHLYLDVEEELAVAATKTVSAQMLVLYMVTQAMLSEQSKLPYRCPEISEIIDKVLRQKTTIDILAEQFVGINEMIVLGRGLNLSVANEIALKLQETCYINARSYAISDFYHGPFALANERTHFLILAMSDHVYEDAVNMIKKIKGVGSNITVFTDNEDIAKDCDNSIIFDKCDEKFTPFECLVAGQLFACALSQKRGINPDQPRGLNKVTITK